MEYTKLGRTGLDVSRLCLGCMSYGEPDRGSHIWTLGEAASRPLLKKALDLGINFFDTANVYSAGIERGDRRPGAARLRAARRGRDRDQGQPADAQGAQRHGPVAQGHLRGDRRQPEAPRHRLRRPVPDPSLGSARADRGDARGARRRRSRRQGPAHRRVVDVRVAVRESAARVRQARLGALRDDAELRQPALPRGRARDAAALQGRGHRRDPVEPARARPADARVGCDDRSLRERRLRPHPLRADGRGRSESGRGARRGRDAARPAARPGRARLGARQERSHGADRRRDAARAARRRGRRARRSSSRRRTSPSSRRRTCRIR